MLDEPDHRELPLSEGETPANILKPKIGLALGGGVARGWTHIGVLRAMIRAGIKPDIVTGTSIGALVGGAYLTDNLDILEQWARSLNKRRMLSYLDLNFGGSGFISGAKLNKLLEKYLGDVTFEDLDQRFITVTTELATAHEIWLRHGSVAEAIRASYALPGVFPPVNIEGRWLIDGALVNPVPVSVCRAFGARVVIAINLHADPFGMHNLQEGQRLEEENGDDKKSKSIADILSNPQQALMKQLFGMGPKAPGVGTVMLGSLNIVMDRLSRSRLAGDPPDVNINPRIGHFSLLDFDRADEMIAIGEAAFEAHLPQIKEALAILT